MSIVDVQKFSNGRPPSRGKVYVGVYGSSQPETNPAPIYSDYLRLNQIIAPDGVDLDQDGFPLVDGVRSSIYVDGSYSLQIRDASGAPIFTAAEQFNEAKDSDIFDPDAPINFTNNVQFQKDPIYQSSAVNKEFVDRVASYSSSTGTLGDVELSVNPLDDTRFDVSLTDAVFVNHSTLYYPLQFTGPVSYTSLSTPYLATAPATYVGITANKQIVTKDSAFTAEEHRTIAYIGVLTHTMGTSIQAATNNPILGEDFGQLINDMADSIGIINVSGNEIAPVNPSLQIKRTAGMAFGRSINFENNPQSPNVMNSPVKSPLTFFSNYRDASTGVNIGVETAVDPNRYDDGSGTLAAMSGGKYVVHRAYYLPSSDDIVMLYGQREYNTLTQANNRYLSEAFENRNNLRGGVFIGWLFLKSGTIDLEAAFTAGDCKFVRASMFSSQQGSGGSLSLSISPLIISATSYMLSADDKGLNLVFDSPSGCVIGLPPGLGDDFNCLITSATEMEVKVSPQTGATIANIDNYLSLEGRNAVCAIIPRGADSYILTGRTISWA